MTDLDSAIIKKTQNSLGKFVKKPALTDKLLKKPPFRFLHDVINVVGISNLDRQNIDSKLPFVSP